MNKIPSHAMLAIAATLGLGALTGCSEIDPLTRPYAWHETGINAYNIAAMAANPADMNRGRHTNRRRTVNEADAVDRVWNNKPTPLSGGAAGAGGGAGAPAAGANPAGGGT